MTETGMSVADVAALTNSNEGFGNSWFWIVVLFLFGGYGFGGFGKGGEQYATSNEVQRGFDNQNIMQRFDTISQNQVNSAYENAQLINNATITGMQNAFGLSSTINSGFDSVNSRINDLAHQMSDCCCALKTQMLQDKYDALQNEYNLSTMANSNAVQTQNILSTLGTWYAKPPYSPYYTYGTTYGVTA